MPVLPRPEHPRPQFERSDWINLNGPWTFRFDFGQSGGEQGWAGSKGFDRTILVPFCPESSLSGVGHTDFIPALWYHRSITVPQDWTGRRVLLHFGAVDYECTAYVDGQMLGRHVGGSCSFHFDITDAIRPGQTHHLVVQAVDDTRSPAQPVGKQSMSFGSQGCHYTRTTGIWQTVWLEAVHPQGLERVRLVPDLDGGRFILTPTFRSVARGQTWRITAAAEGKPVASAEGPAGQQIPLVVDLSAPRAWSPEDPFLYDLTFEVLNEAGEVVDRVQSYTGLRKVHVEGNRVFLNNQPIYQRLVLDQGFYPDGIWTAPSDAALRHDIELSMAAGFNGARLHQKVFEERFHYWADRLGYLTWGEFASWGLGAWDGKRDYATGVSGWNMLDEWREVVLRDLNHPSIIAWTPLNETRDPGNRAAHRRLHEDLYDLTRSLDPTRPVNDASGYVHVRTDLWTVHNYEQDPQKLAAQLTSGEDGVWRNFPREEPPYAGQPYLVDEFGGIKWIPEDRRPHAANSWGYGEAPKTLEEFYGRLEGQVEALLSLEHISGYCYTQLTDVEQEENGIYNYDRSAKFDMQRIADIFRREPKTATVSVSR